MTKQLADKKEGKKGRFVTVRVQKKTLKRVVKAKPMTRKHMADALNAPKVTEKEIRITEEVIERFAKPSTARSAPDSLRTFKCFECGTPMPIGAPSCPKCRVRYLSDVSEGDIEELMKAELLPDEDSDESVSRDGSPVVHFDAESGIMHYLNDEQEGPDIMFECSQCGTLVEVSTDKCPMCGEKLEAGDLGLVGVFSGMEFDSEPLEEVDCPFCGEHVTLSSGKCTACGEVVEAETAGDPSAKVVPVLRADNVVFLHLDIESGELNYVQKTLKKVNYDHVSVQLEGIGSSGFDREWSSLSRI